MAFYTFDQNDSGGSFDGPTHVIVEADSADHANERAQDVAGIYFDGCDTGTDCSCCGDRWYRAHAHDGDNIPQLYSVFLGENLEEQATDSPDNFQYLYPGDIPIYYLDGSSETVSITKELLDKAAKAKKAATNSAYGFSIYQNGTLLNVSPMKKIYHSDYDTSNWYGSDGNHIVLRKNNKDGWQKDNYGLYYSHASRQEALAVHKIVSNAIEIATSSAKSALNLALKTVVETTANADAVNGLNKVRIQVSK